MTKELADIVGLVEGERALHIFIGPYGINLIPIIVKEVIINGASEVVVKTDKYEAYLNPSTIYSKLKLLSLLVE